MALYNTCASSLVSGWWGRRWSLEEVRELLGHADLHTTQRYAHLASDAMAEAAKATGRATSVGAAGSQGAPFGQAEAGSFGHDIGHGKIDRSANPSKLLAPPTRIERVANGLGNRCSIP